MIIFQIILLLILLAIIFMEGSFLYASIIGAPTVYSSERAIVDALELAKLKKGETVIDLGCGNARALIIAAQKFGANGIGVDRSPYCILIARLRIRLSGQSSKIKIIWGDFRKVEKELKNADVVYLYLLNTVLAKIEPWFFKHVGDQTRIVSLAFSFSNHEPQAIVPTRTLGSDTKVRLYKKVNSSI